MNANQKRPIEDAVADVFAKADARIESGCVPIMADWQATLELYILMARDHLLSNKGQLVPIQIDDQDEWNFYLDIMEILDLPPDTCALLMTPSGSKSMPIPSSLEIDRMDVARWSSNTYSILIGDGRDNERIIHAALPGAESVGIDVMEDGNHLADYSYYTIAECLSDLSNVTWTYLRPKNQWNREQITRYTNNWYGKITYGLNIEDVPCHSEYSYLHHPKLLELTPLDTAFMVLEATIPKEYDSLEKAVELTNDINQDMDLGYPIVTEAGVGKDNQTECQTLLDRIVVEIDTQFELMMGIRGIKMPDRVNNPAFNSLFDDTAKRLYRTVAGRDCPESVEIR